MKQDNAESVLINQTASNYFSVLSITAANNFLRFIFFLRILNSETKLSTHTHTHAHTRSCPKTPLTARHLKHTRYINTSTVGCACIPTSLHWSNHKSPAMDGFARANPIAVSCVPPPPLLLWVVWLKSNKYQAERLTSVSHFRRTTARDNIWTAA